MFGESVYLYGVSPMLRFGKRAFDGKKLAISRGLPMLYRMGLGWNGGRVGRGKCGWERTTKGVFADDRCLPDVKYTPILRVE